MEILGENNDQSNLFNSVTKGMKARDVKKNSSIRLQACQLKLRAGLSPEEYKHVEGSRTEFIFGSTVLSFGRNESGERKLCRMSTALDNPSNMKRLD